MTGLGTVAPATAPPFPTALAGYRASAPVLVTLRAFSEGSRIPGWFATQNHCNLSVRTVRWRSLGSAIRVDVTYAGTGEVVSSPEEATRGLLTLSQCHEPRFAAIGQNSVIDVAVEYIVWNASP